MSEKRSEHQLLHHDASSATLIFVLKFAFVIWFLRFLFDPLPQLSQLPVEYTNPVGWLNWFPVSWYMALHSFVGLSALKVLILGCCIGVWIPKYRIPAALVGCLAITTVSAITRGFGHMNHAETGPLLVTWIITLYAMRIPRNLAQHPNHESNATASAGMVTATFVFAFAYALVGIARMCNGGIDLMAGETITHRLVAMSYHDWLIEYNFAEFVLANPWMLYLLKVGFAVVTVLEIAAPFCLFSRRLRLVTLIVMPIFHLGVVFLFKVYFIEQALMLILFVNLTPWLAGKTDFGGLRWLREAWSPMPGQEHKQVA